MPMWEGRCSPVSPWECCSKLDTICVVIVDVQHEPSLALVLSEQRTSCELRRGARCVAIQPGFGADGHAAVHPLQDHPQPNLIHFVGQWSSTGEEHTGKSQWVRVSMQPSAHAAALTPLLFAVTSPSPRPQRGMEDLVWSPGSLVV